MIMNKYTIFDSSVKFYHQDYTLHTDDEAIRQFTDMTNEDTKIAKHPEDYTLWKIGTWDNQTGELFPQEIECIAKAHELVYTNDKN